MNNVDITSIVSALVHDLKDDMDKLSVSEKVKLYNANPEQYKEIYGGN